MVRPYLHGATYLHGTTIPLHDLWYTTNNPKAITNDFVTSIYHTSVSTTIILIFDYHFDSRIQSRPIIIQVSKHLFLALINTTWRLRCEAASGYNTTLLRLSVGKRPQNNVKRWRHGGIELAPRLRRCASSEPTADQYSVALGLGSPPMVEQTGFSTILSIILIFPCCEFHKQVSTHLTMSQIYHCMSMIR